MTVPVRSAVILAAGQGQRLRSEVEGYPKGFLRLGERPIVEESILRLLAAGIEDVVIVTGYAAEYYEALAQAYPGTLRTVHNADFARSGSMYSLYCAREALRGPFLLLESDLIYEPRALQVLLAGLAEDALLLSGPTGAGDEVYVEAPGGWLRAMSKDRASLGSGVAGELVGISRISAGLFALMQRIAAQAFTQSLRFDYETGCLVAAARERPIACLRVDDLLWGEIDDPAQLRRARAGLYARIAALDAGLRSGVAPCDH
ncbi:MAG: phosphocholine cytidylyltransferase family protein [Gammaproteobacteria bacterium]|nr:phosphocholine cytidylyltransferase family protein [Gammaproteobacteria bacterium]